MRYRGVADGGRVAQIMPGAEISTNVQVAGGPVLAVDGDLHRPTSVGVIVNALDPDQMTALARYVQGGGLLQAILRISVARTGTLTGLPDVFGRHQVLEDGVRFAPHFPFERGLSYRASFDPRPLGHPRLSEALSLEFLLPKEQNASSTAVTHIFPSGDRLPENLLRFYVCFSNSMQRGRAEAEISLLGPDGEPTEDALYRAPAELWDRGMQCLTVLLDPGRLKRGVGPNRELGPPLKSGQVYTLAIGAGMTDTFGSQLCETAYKRFRVTDAVREPIALEQWEIVPPATNSRQPLVIKFPRSLDWALLSQMITISSTCQQSIGGQIAIDQCERRWSFTPASPWTAGPHHVRVASGLEDVCGNSVVAAFDRPLRSGCDPAHELASRSIPFGLA
jgi:hypothetical protein